MECLICRSGNLKTIGLVDTSKRYEVTQCRKCAMVFTLPRPTHDELIAHYSAEYFTNSKREAGYADYYSIGEMNMRNMWPSFKEYAEFKPQVGRRMLDVGCASGAFLDEARKDGWNTKGIELSNDAVRRANKEYHLDVLGGDIFDSRLSPKTFDVLTMWHILEHTIDPLAVLKRAHELLDSNGALFIELPNWNSLGRIVNGMKWKQLVPPAHLNFFNTKSMPVALEQAGFNVVKCSTLHVAGFDILRSRVPKVALPLVGAVEGLVSKLGRGGYLRALALKKE